MESGLFLLNLSGEDPAPLRQRLHRHGLRVVAEFTDIATWRAALDSAADRAAIATVCCHSAAEARGQHVLLDAAATLTPPEEVQRIEQENRRLAQRSEALLRLARRSFEAGERELIAAAMQEAMRLTCSSTAYLAVFFPGRRPLILVLNSRGEEVPESLHHTTCFFSPDQAAFIARSLAREQVMIYSGNSCSCAGRDDSTDCPPCNLLSVPVMDSRRVRLQLVLCGSSRAYDPIDEQTASSIATDVWRHLLRIRGQRALQASEHRYRTLFESNPNPMWVIDTETLRFLAVNEAAVKHYGYSEAEFLSMSSLDIRPECDREAYRRSVASVGSGVQPRGRWHHITKSGAEITIDATVAAINFSGHRALLVLIRDVTEQVKTEELLRKLFAAVEQSPASIVITNNVPEIEYVNPRFTELTGYTREEAIGKNPSLQKSGVMPTEFYKGLWETILAGNTWHGEFLNRRKNGEPYWEMATISPIRNADGAVTHFVAVKEDITARRQVEEFVRRLAAEREQLLDALENQVWYLVTPETYGAVNRAHAHFLGREKSAVENRALSEVLPAEVAESRAAFAKALFDRGERLTREEWVPDAEGRQHLLSVTGLPLQDPEGTVIGAVCTATDLTERWLAEDRLRHASFHDGLTGLANSRLLRERITHSLQRHAQDPEHDVALLEVNIDRFKLINDTLGHVAGDQLVMEVAQRLQQLPRPERTLGRTGGDEFVVFLPDIASRSEPPMVAQWIREAIQRPFLLEGREVRVTCSIGMVIDRAASTSANELLSNADAALHEAKANGRNCVVSFDPSIRSRAEEMLLLEQDLRVGLHRGELFVVFQPIVNLRDGSLHGYEALVRWNHPRLGQLAPAQFLPVADEAGLLADLESQVLLLACKKLAALPSEPGTTPPLLNVNISPAHFARPNLVMEVQEALVQSGLPPSRLNLEIVESVLQSDPARIESKLQELRRLGVQFSIDDFGTGYSSLERLFQYPISGLKIDKSFVREMDSNPRQRQLVQIVTNLTHQLELTVTAEGVETESQRSALCELGCDFAQGYLFGKPEPLDAR